MKSSLHVGNTAEIVITVTEDMCPAFDGLVVHKVYSTWSMGHHFELAARKVLKDHLEEHEEGIGSHLSIDHLAPTPVGHQVRIIAKATKLESTTLVCDLSAYHILRNGKEKLIGRGKQIQRILPKTTLNKLIQRDA